MSYGRDWSSGCLPLALEQDAAYLNQHRIPTAAYRDRLREPAGGLLAGVAAGQDAQRAVTSVWTITLDALTTTDPVAVEILRVLAWLTPDDLPRDLIADLTGGDQTAADLALGLLASYSMITLDETTISVHRLVQAVLRRTTPAGRTTTDPKSQAARLLNTGVPDDPDSDPAGWPRWRDLLPHIIALFERVQGRYGQGEIHSARALAIAEAPLGPRHPTVAASLGNLAVNYGRPGAGR